MGRKKKNGALKKPHIFEPIITATPEISEVNKDDEIILKYFGCSLKYLRKRGTSITIDVIGMAYDGVEVKKGLLEGRE